MCNGVLIYEWAGLFSLCDEENTERDITEQFKLNVLSE